MHLWPEPSFAVFLFLVSPIEIQALTFFCIFLCFSGYALKCNQCLSDKSWDECNNTTTQANCKDGEDRCAKEEVKSEISGKTVKIFAKGCTTSSLCSQGSKNCKSTNPSVKITKCEVDCCKGDLCNGAQVPMVSATMLLACAIVVFAR